MVLNSLPPGCQPAASWSFCKRYASRFLRMFLRHLIPIQLAAVLGAARNNLREALQLFKQTGYEIRDRQLVDIKTGEPYEIEFLGNNAGFERIFLFYKPSLERIGINVTVRTVDEAQYENRLRNWDFDIITYAWPEILSPGSELRDYWGSQAADQAGSDNVIGINNSGCRYDNWPNPRGKEP